MQTIVTSTVQSAWSQQWILQDVVTCLISGLHILQLNKVKNISTQDGQKVIHKYHEYSPHSPQTYPLSQGVQTLYM